MSVTIERVGFAPNYVNYVECLEDQYRIHDEVANRTRQNTILLLEHEPVITAGKRTEDHEYPADKSTPVVKIDRGGKLTWHGPADRLPPPSPTRTHRRGGLRAHCRGDYHQRPGGPGYQG